MARTEKVIASECRVLKIRSVVQEAIGVQCKASGYQISYAEINLALTTIMSGNLSRELKEETKEE